MTCLGIDAGIKGGFALLDSNKKILLAKETPTYKKTLQSHLILDIMMRADYIILEEQFIVKAQGNKGNFTTAYNYGKLCALGEVVKADFGVVNANTWQSAYTFTTTGERKTKKHHITLAKALAKEQGNLIITDGIADAYLIAYNSLQRLQIANKRNPQQNNFYNLFKAP